MIRFTNTYANRYIITNAIPSGVTIARLGNHSLELRMNDIGSVGLLFIKYRVQYTVNSLNDTL